MRKHSFTLPKQASKYNENCKMGNMYTVGGGTALCKQSYVTLCRCIQVMKLFFLSIQLVYKKVAALLILSAKDFIPVFLTSSLPWQQLAKPGLNIELSL